MGTYQIQGIINSTTEDCIVMYNPGHESDYIKFCIRVTHQGSYAFVSVNDFGQSKQLSKANYAEYYKSGRKGKNRSCKVGSVIGQGIMTLGKSKQKLEIEQMYYQYAFDIFDVIFHQTSINNLSKCAK